MRPFLAALVATLAFAAPAGAVVGGQPVPEGQFPYVANVQVMGAFGCTGTLIAPQWVLTAGHCGSATGSLSQGLVASPVAWPARAYTVALGSVYADGHGAERHDVAQVVVDSGYTVTNGSGNDVTLMKLDTPSKIAPMRIAAVGERASWQPGVLATIAGFGATSPDASQMPDRMQVAKVPITTDEYCARAYGGGSFDARTMVCAGYPQGGTDTCDGDSGGPLLAPVKDGFRLAGATSFGSGCAQAGKPGVYARVAEGPIREWLKGVVPEAFAPEPVATKPAAKPRKRQAARRCSRRSAREHSRGKRARSRSCRRASRR
ncbi:MAG TPA: serine protease [Thermoleophilaceae bacterium]|nr:serine protease [Thermoleophilaceae bacterium]